MKKIFYTINAFNLPEQFENADIQNLSDEDFVYISDQCGKKYTQDEFVKAFNDSELSTQFQWLRIIDVK